MERILESNKVCVVGKVLNEPTYDHESHGQRMYMFYLEVPRTSGVVDVLPIKASERTLRPMGDIQGKVLEVTGQFRSYSYRKQRKKHITLNVFALEIKETSEEIGKNDIYLNGLICKKGVYRETFSGKEVIDVVIGVNRDWNQSDYIPCIAWGVSASCIQNMVIGSGIELWGRVQSRQYKKKTETGEVITKTVYEVSISNWV